MIERPTDDRTPGDRRPTDAGRRILARAPSQRYDGAPRERLADTADDGIGPAGGVRAAGAPIARAALATLLGSIAMIVTGGILATNGGLLFIGALAGAVAGLLLARAAVPGRGVPAMTRTSVVRGAIVLAIGGVLVGATGIWIVSRIQGGVLDPVDYFVQTSGGLIPIVALVAAVTAAWGASAGPVQS